MNLLLMGLMMGLMLVFFHGKGHHKSGPAPEHHTTKPDEKDIPSSKAPGADRRPGEPSAEPGPGTRKTPPK